MTIRIDTDGAVRTITIDRPQVRNAVDGATARALYDAFVEFDEDERLHVAVLTGAGKAFCSGADLKAISAGAGNPVNAMEAADIEGSLGPMGPTRMLLRKPVIAAVEGYAVAGGLELAIWCDLRVAAQDASFGVFCRRWGVPLVDGGTIRLPRLIGHSRALDLILTGREVGADEALQMGLVNRVVESGGALGAAQALARELSALPQLCLRSDRESSYRQWGSDLGTALSAEAEVGLETIRSGETEAGATRFTGGAGRHGEAAD